MSAEQFKSEEVFADWHPKDESKEHKDGGTKEFTYLDKEGKEVCRVVVEMGTARRILRTVNLSDGEHGRATEVRGVHLKGNKNGQEIDLNVLKLVNLPGMTLYVADQRQDNYYYNDETQSAVSPPLESAVDFAVMLHELGHAEQFQDPRMKDFLELVDKKLARSADLTHFSQIDNKLSTLAELIPRVADVVSSQEYSEVKSAYGNIAEIRQIINKKEKEVRDIISEREKYFKDFVLQKIQYARLRELMQDATDRSNEGSSTADSLAQDVADLVRNLEECGFVFSGEPQAQEAGQILVPSSDSIELEEGEAKPSVEKQTRVLSKGDLSDLGSIVNLITGMEQRLSHDITSTQFFPDDDYIQIQINPSSSFASKSFVYINISATKDEQAIFRREMEEMSAKLEQGKADTNNLGTEEINLMERVKSGIVELNLADLLSLPTKVSERNASARAMVNFLKIKHKGIDLLKAVQTPAVAALDGRRDVKKMRKEGCVESATSELYDTLAGKTINYSPKQNLRDALDTYDASRSVGHRLTDEGVKFD